jgi:hypothetical protein
MCAERRTVGGGLLLDLPMLRAHTWASWHVFAYAFVVYLLGIVAIVYEGSLDGLGLGTLFEAALLASIAAAGVGYQEVREASEGSETAWTRFADDEWGW